MLTFKAYINESGRDPHETLKHLETLANHPNTPKHEAEAARGAAARLRQTHNIPHHTEKPTSTGTTHQTHKESPKTKNWIYKHPTKSHSTYGPHKGFVHKHEDGTYTSHHSMDVGTKNRHKSFHDAHVFLTKQGYKPDDFHYAH